ncbi:MAG: hypothetical protein J7L95_05410, partial [Prolixibacteraceae bacterium]|nr:hypothetical protein [Prolixibacteraceae bacterium]
EVKIENLNFSSDAPIIIKAYNDEKVTFDGTVALKNLKWEKDPTYPNVWQAHIPVDVCQLFVDGRMMINARWPNAQHPFENEEYSSWFDETTERMNEPCLIIIGSENANPVELTTQDSYTFNTNSVASVGGVLKLSNYMVHVKFMLKRLESTK